MLTALLDEEHGLVELGVAQLVLRVVLLVQLFPAKREPESYLKCSLRPRALFDLQFLVGKDRAGQDLNTYLVKLFFGVHLVGNDSLSYNRSHWSMLKLPYMSFVVVEVINELHGLLELDLTGIFVRDVQLDSSRSRS